MRKLLMSAMVASALGVAATAMPAVADTQIYLNFGPPPVRYEPVPAHRPGYVWAPGYWDYRGKHHVWRTGHWVKARPGYIYYAPAWQEVNGRYFLQRGYWVEAPRVARGPQGDRDHDGVPNRYDNFPNDSRYR